MAKTIGRACALLSAAFLFIASGASCDAHVHADVKAEAESDMKASFHLHHDTETATVTSRPSVQAGQSASLDYRIKITKQGAAGKSTQSNGGRIDVIAGQDVEIGPLLRFGSFAEQDSMHLELRLCRAGSRCKQDADVIARFSESYPVADGEHN